MAEALARAGCSLVLWARTPATLERVAHRLRGRGREVLTQCVDVTNPRQVRQAVAQATRRFGRLDILVNNAGIWDGDPLTKLRLQAWSRVVTTDLTSVFLGVDVLAVTPDGRKAYIGNGGTGAVVSGAWTKN